MQPVSRIEAALDELKAEVAALRASQVELLSSRANDMSNEV